MPMPYNYNGYNYFPQSYQPQQMYGQQQMNNQQIQQAQAQAQAQAQNNQIQQSGFIPVPSEDVARNYPVAPGNSVSFKNENAPYVYVKTMGYSPLDRPTFEKFRLVKEETAEPQTSVPNAQASAPAIDLSNYSTKEEVNSIKEELDSLKESFLKFREVVKSKKEVRVNDEQ